MRDLSTTRTCRVLTLGAVIATVTTLTTAAPAFAAGQVVQTKQQLSDLLSNAPVGTRLDLVLGATLNDVTTPWEDITVRAGSDVHLDLSGHRVNLNHLTIADGAVLTVTDPSSPSVYGWNPGLDVENGAVGSTAPSGIEIGAGATLKVDHAGVYGKGSNDRAGIGSAGSTTSDAGSVIVTGRASVYAQGGAGAAGIGGAPGADAVSLSVADSTVRANGGVGGAGIGSGRGGAAGDLTVTTTPAGSVDGYDHSDVAGEGGMGAAGIGGGVGGTGAAIVLSGHGFASATAGPTDPNLPGRPAAVGLSQGTPVTAERFGSLRIGAQADLYVPGGSDLTVPAGVTVQNDGSIGLRGTASGDGVIANVGTIGLDQETLDGPDDASARVGVAVTGHNYEVHLDTAGGGTTGRTVIHTFFNWFDTYSIAEPTAPRDGDELVAWNTATDATGLDPDEHPLDEIAGLGTDGSPVSLTLHARYGAAPRFTSTTLTDAAVGAEYDQALPATGNALDGYMLIDTDENGDPLPALPAGLRLDPRTGHVTGTPTEAGTATFQVAAFSRAAARVFTRGTITLRVTDVPRLLTSSLPHAGVGSPYAVQLASSARDGAQFEPAGGTLPDGLTLSPTGLLSGTPTTVGTSTFDVRVSTDRGASTTTLVLGVDGAPAAVTADPPAEAAPADPATQPTASSVSTALVPSTAPVPSTPPATAAAAVPPTAPAGAPAAVPAAAPTASAAPAAVAPAAPVLPTIPRKKVGFGHRLDMAVGASSILPVDYTLQGDLPKGVALSRTTGVISGIPAEVGTFTATITATSAAGSDRASVVITVPQVTELIDTAPVPAVTLGSGPLAVRVSGLLKGERWTMVVDGKTVKTGTIKRAGRLATSVPLKPVKRDTVHHVVIRGSRAVSDPAQRAATTFTITSLAQKKDLAVTSSARHGVALVTTRRLAAGERVTVEIDGKVVARRSADGHGHFAFASRTLLVGKHEVRITGASDGRTDTATVHGKRS